MKKLLTILAITTLISCSKEEEQAVTECHCWEHKMKEVVMTETEEYVVMINYSECSEYSYLDTFRDMKLNLGVHCYDEPIKYE